MDPVDIFSHLVTGSFENHPGLARRFIRTGYAAQQMLLRLRPEKELLPSQRHLAEISMRHTRKPMQYPEQAALVNLFFPCELLHAMDIAPQCVEGFSAFLSGGKCERGFLKYAEERGVPDTYCSFHKALLGAVFSGVVKKPRFILTTNTVCDANMTTFDAIARHFEMPRILIDVPFEESDDAVGYVADQLERMILQMEETLGRRIEPGRLQAAIKRSNAALTALQKYLSNMETKFIPTTATTELYRILCNHILMGSEDAQVFYERLSEDSQACPPHIGKRILWCHLLPFHADSLQGLFLHEEGVQLLVSDLCYDAMLPLDAENPLQSIARRLILNHFNGPLERRCESVVQMARRLRADGAVLFCHWGCKQSNGGAFGLRDALRAEGLQTVVLDGDGCDRSNMSQGQFDTRLQAFLEMLEERG